MKVRAETLKIGEKILPPAREVQLWMRRACQEKNLPESALHLTITGIEEGSPDKNGRWLIFTTEQTPEWHGGTKPFPFRFKARPETPWPKV